jgi:hypothetical protein
LLNEVPEHLMTGTWAMLVVAACAVVPPQSNARILVRLWQNPGPIAARNLRWGPGAAERAPKPPFAFVEHSGGGTQPKLQVTDAAGVTWDVKFGEEVHAEIAASRLVWALGYYVDELYYVGEGVISGLDDPGRATDHVDASGRFRHARFERRQEHHHAVDEGWSFGANPFVGTRELSGLKILMTLIGNWDIEGERNNRLVEVRESRKEAYRQYFVGDLGGSFGHMGTRLTKKSKWRLQDYQQDGFIDEVDDDLLELDFDGMEPDIEAVPIDHARWLSRLLDQLTPAQVRQAFEAAGATPEEVDGFSQVVLTRIATLRDALAGAASATAPAPAP